MTTSPVVDPRSAGTELVRVCLCVCTHRRNHFLRRLIDAAIVAQSVSPELEISVLVVDDNPDQAAAEVIEDYAGALDGRIDRVWSGRQNISIARNMALDEGMKRGDWLALLDDDIEPSPRWLSELVATQRRTGADFVVGPRSFELAPDAPGWFKNADLLRPRDLPDGTPLPNGGEIANLLVSADWLRSHPDVRLDTDFGVTGGEDMVFMSDAMAAGGCAVFSAAAMVTETYPSDRCTLRYLLRGSVWLGNNELLINKRVRRYGTGRMALRSCKNMLRGSLAAAASLVRRRPADGVAGLLQACRGVGILIGLVGVRVKHR